MHLASRQQHRKLAGGCCGLLRGHARALIVGTYGSCVRLAVVTVCFCLSVQNAADRLQGVIAAAAVAAPAAARAVSEVPALLEATRHMSQDRSGTRAGVGAGGTGHVLRQHHHSTSSRYGKKSLLTCVFSMQSG